MHELVATVVDTDRWAMESDRRAVLPRDAPPPGRVRRRVLYGAVGNGLLAVRRGEGDEEWVIRRSQLYYSCMQVSAHAMCVFVSLRFCRASRGNDGIVVFSCFDSLISSIIL